MLALRDIRKSFRGVNAIDGVSLDIPDRGVFGLVGPNGAGKTTLVNLVTGYLRPDAGTISYRDEDVVGLAPHKLAARGVARTYQNLRLFEGSTVRENVLIGRHMAVAARRGRRRRRDDLAEQLVARLGLEPYADVEVDELSYGLRRRVEIARALATECTTLLLDEPTAGMTASEAGEIGALMRSLGEQGVSVLLVEHNIKLVTQTCDRIAVLDFGRVIAEGPPAEVWEQEAVRTAYIGKRREQA